VGGRTRARWGKRTQCVSSKARGRRDAHASTVQTTDHRSQTTPHLAHKLALLALQRQQLHSIPQLLPRQGKAVGKAV
jgi:hypothetical protein